MVHEWPACRFLCLLQSRDEELSHPAGVGQKPGEQKVEAILEPGDLIVNSPLEHHAFECLEDSTMLVLTRGPRGGEDYEKDTFRLEVPLIS